VAIGANSYGSAAEVAAMVPQYTSSGSFSTATRPTLVQVEKFIDRVFALVNTVLAQLGFAVPVSQADAKLALDHFVVEEVAELCEAVNRAGRFAQGALQSRSRFDIVFDDCLNYLRKYAEGLEALGATRTRDMTYGLSYWDTDDAGDEIEPIFDRKWMRQETTDWDEA